MQDRCPWCGKKVNIRKRSFHHKKTPIRFIFDRCISCDQYYGQYYRSPRNIILSFAMILCLVFPLILPSIGLFCLLILLGIFSVMILHSPIVRMNEDEELVVVNKTEHIGKVVWFAGKIKKKYIYCCVNNFDDFSSFVKIAPIYITSVSSRENVVKFYFLYDHVDNNVQRILCLYDGKKKAAELEMISVTGNRIES